MYKYSFPIKVSLSSLSEKVSEVVSGINKKLDQFNQNIGSIDLWTTMAHINVTCKVKMTHEQIEMIKKEAGELYNKTLEGYDHMICDPEITEV